MLDVDEEGKEDKEALGVKNIKSVNWCSEHIALDITPQEKMQWCYVW
jgi:hypothetical protein